MLLTRMRGDGLHDQHSPLQRCIIEAAAPLIDYAAIRVPIPPKRAFSIVDYGCSEGRNSVDSVRKIIHSVLEREPQKWISVLHNDLPHNDFNTLFGNLYASEQASYLSKADERYTGSKVFAFVSGASFYGRVSPDESVDFAISSCATHWLSSLPDYAIPNHIYHGCASKEDTEKISRIAATDWRRFLEARAEELAPGARLVLTMAARIPQPDGQDLIPGRSIMDLMNDTLLDLISEGRIIKELYDRFALPIYLRSVEETVAPMYDPKLNLRQFFTVEYVEAHPVKCDYFERLRERDANSYAEAVVQSIRACTQPALESGLFCHALSQAQHSGTIDLKNQLSAKDRGTIDSLYSRMKQRVAAAPERYLLEPLSIFLVLTRK